MTNDQRAAVAGVFDRAAETYDQVGVELFGPIAGRLVAELAPHPGEVALDIGCGRGAALLPLAEAVGPSGRVVGIDLSPRMVEAAAAQVAARSVGATVEVRVGDAQGPDLTPGTFDVIASSLVLFFRPDPPGALSAWRELLADGGRLGISSFGPFSEHWHEVDAVFKPYLPAQMADPRTQRQDSPFNSDEGVEHLLAGAGFSDVRTVTFDLEVRFADADHWHRWTWSVGQRRMWEAIPEDRWDEVRRQASERLEATRDAEGRIGFDQTVRLTLGRR